MSRLSGEICRTCRAWDLFGEGMGQCRLRSPELALMDPEIMAKRTNLKIASPMQAMWPVTFADDWCFEHKPYETKKESA